MPNRLTTHHHIHLPPPIERKSEPGVLEYNQTHNLPTTVSPKILLVSPVGQWWTVAHDLV